MKILKDLVYWIKIGRWLNPIAEMKTEIKRIKKAKKYEKRYKK